MVKSGSAVRDGVFFAVFVSTVETLAYPFQSVTYLCESLGLLEAAAYWHQVIILNDAQQQRLVTRLFREMFNTLANRKIAVFGFAFKADTGDTRESPAAAVARLLAEEHAKLQITDPKALENAKNDLSDLSCAAFTEDPYEAAKGADAVLVMTPWREYAALDWRKIYSLMRHPSLVYDAHNILSAPLLREIGFKVLNTGR